MGHCELTPNGGSKSRMTPEAGGAGSYYLSSSKIRVLFTPASYVSAGFELMTNPVEEQFSDSPIDDKSLKPCDQKGDGK